MMMKTTGGWLSARTPYASGSHPGWRAGEIGGADIAPRRASAPSAAAFVTRVILISIAAVMGLVLIVTAPRTVTIPLAVVLVGGMIASWVAVSLKGWLPRGHSSARRIA